MVLFVFAPAPPRVRPTVVTSATTIFRSALNNEICQKICQKNLTDQNRAKSMPRMPVLQIIFCAKSGFFACQLGRCLLLAPAAATLYRYAALIAANAAAIVVSNTYVTCSGVASPPKGSVI